MARKIGSTTSDAIKILDRRYYEGKLERLASLEKERLNADIAREIYALRTTAKLTQRALAELVGTTASVICRLEDADYEGHSLSMLQRIATALGRRVQIHLIPLPEVPRPRSRGVSVPKSVQVKAARKKIAG